jgi:hypothetical protein
MQLRWLQPVPVTERDMRNYDVQFGEQIKVSCHQSDPTIFTKRFTNSDVNSGEELLPEISHMHVLQNLYFAFCGEEMP